jgi:cytochrome c-type biogenesis protein CcmF
VRAAFSRAAGLPRSAWGTAIAHAGVGVCVIGIAATAWHTEDLKVMKPGDTLTRGDSTIVMESYLPRTGPNFRAMVARFRVIQDGVDSGVIESSKRTFITRNNMQTTEAGLRTFGFSQVYVSIGEQQPDGAVGVRLYTKPLVLLIWIGSLIMALGAGLSITDRRFRVAAPGKARAPVGGPLPQPAE